MLEIFIGVWDLYGLDVLIVFDEIATDEILWWETLVSKKDLIIFWLPLLDKIHKAASARCII